MKLIDFTNIALGQELSPSFAKQTQEGFLTALTALIKGLCDNPAGIIIIEGCEMVVVGTQYDQTAGVVYYNGEIFTVDAFSGNDAVLIPVYQPAQSVFSAQAWYGDGVKRNTFYTRKLNLALAAAGSGVADYNAVTRLSKANRTQSNWVNLNLVNAWAVKAGAYTPSYRIDQFGRVNLRGQLEGMNATATKFTDNLPAPANGISISTLKSLGAGSPAQTNLSINNIGEGFMQGGSYGNAPTTDTFNLDGISYWKD